MKAYPFLHKHPTSGETTISEGMELRDWFAGMAMPVAMETLRQDFTKDDGNKWYWDSIELKLLAEQSYLLADAMMLQRKALSDE